MWARMQFDRWSNEARKEGEVEERLQLPDSENNVTEEKRGEEAIKSHEMKESITTPLTPKKKEDNRNC